MKDHEYLTIEDTSGSQDVFDVAFLKERAIAELQKLTGKRWTDYNIHDPGITTLEILCFAITELAYRADYNVQDIFYQRTKEDVTSDTFYKAEEILNSGAISINDLKRLILDIEGIKNIEIVQAQNQLEFNGIFDVFVEAYDIDLSDNSKSKIEREIQSLISNNRVLCTIINEIEFFESDKLSVQLEIELSGKVIPSDFLRAIASSIEGYFSPNPAYQSLKELLEDNVPVEDIFSGPLLKNGFITESNIETFQIKNHILVADLVNVLMDVEKVVHISKLKLQDSKKEEHNWSYQVQEGMVPRLDFENSNLTVTYKGKESFSLPFNTLRTEKMHISNGISASHKNNTLPTPKGVKRDFLNYRSIQHDFPKIYGLGEAGLPVGATVDRMGHTKQFKGFLSLFDQVLANYFSQLNNLKQLFSLEDIKTTTAVQMLEKTPGIYWLYKPFMDSYLTANQNIDDEHHIKKEWLVYLENNKEAIEAEILGAVENEDKFLERRSRILDHLLARFGIDLTSFEFVAQLSIEQLIQHKIKILKSLREVGKSKIKGVDPLNLGFNKLEDRSGFEKYLYLVLGFGGGNTARLTEVPSSLFKNSKKVENKITFQFKGQNTSEILCDLFLLGSLKHNFLVQDDQLKLISKKGEIFASSKIVSKNEEAQIHSLFGKIAELNSNSEGFYLVEHLLLKPSDEMKAFGFAVPIDDESVFESSYDLERKERDELISAFCNKCSSSDSFKIVEVELYQYKVMWTDGNSKLMGCYFFESREAANSAIKRYISIFSEKVDIEGDIIRATKYHEFYNEVTDPFSNIVTYVFPDWPNRFQNNAFKKYIEDFILAETPAHIFANILWLDFEEMTAFENQFENWIQCPYQPEVMKQKKLEALLPYLVKN